MKTPGPIRPKEKYNIAGREVRGNLTTTSEASYALEIGCNVIVSSPEPASS